MHNISKYFLKLTGTVKQIALAKERISTELSIAKNINQK